MAVLIELEGIDGSGKTTALKYVIEQLRAKGKKVLETREVGNPHIPVCVKLRELILDPNSNLDGEAMEYIFAAMRIENNRFYEKVANDYDFIVSDRGWLSHLAYTDHNVSYEFTDNFYYSVISYRTKMPDMVIYLSVDSETSLKRRVKRGEVMDVIEMKGVEFQEKVRQSFEEHIDALPLFNSDALIEVINANVDQEGVRRQLDKVIEQLTGDLNV